MDRLVISVTRRTRPSERLLKGAMAGLAALFLLLGIALNRGLMLPCFLMAVCYFVYSGATRRQYEYILEDGHMRIDRLAERRRIPKHEFPLKSIEILARPDDPAVAMYRKGGGEKLPRFDYTSYEEGVPYYTVIANEDGRKIKLLMDLDAVAIDRIRRENRGAVKC